MNAHTFIICLIPATLLVMWIVDILWIEPYLDRKFNDSKGGES